MKSIYRQVLVAAGLAMCTAAQAQITVKDAWVRATVPQQRGTGAFMQIHSAKDSKLVGARSSLTAAVEVHEMRMQDNVMRMRPVAAVALPAGKTVELKPGGYHVMLMDLKQQVKEGHSVPLTLVFEGNDGKRESINVNAQVRALNAAGTPADQPKH